MSVHLEIPSLAPAVPLGSAARQGSLREPLPAASPAPTSASSNAAQAETLVHISAEGRQSLNEASMALKNQNTLLQALDQGVYSGPARPTSTAASVPLPLAPALPNPQGSAAPPASTGAGAAMPVPTSATPATAATPMPTGLGRSDGQAAIALPIQGMQGQASANANRAVTAGAATALALPPWPSNGVSKPLQQLVQTLVQQTTSSASGSGQRVLAMQPWPAALVSVVDPQPQVETAPGLAPLHTWLVRQGVVQTPEGPRGVSVSLRVPLPWLRAWEQAQAQTTAGQPAGPGNNGTLAATPASVAPRPLQLVFTGPSASLQSGTLALALESPGMAGVRTSALMLLEFQPLLHSSARTQASTLYGRYAAAPHLYQNPWLHMATLQASGQVRHEEEDMVHANAALCDTPGCPYQGQTACVQPFCMALRAPTPVDALAGSSSVPSPDAPGLRSR